MKSQAKKSKKPDGLAKCPSGIRGLDEIVGGGLPRGRPTLVCGGAGSGKTLLGMEFIVRGARDFNEPGVFIAFEETESELTTNVASLDFDLADLQRRKKMVLDHIYIERSEFEETGEYDLEGLFIRIGSAIDSIGAKRIVLDSLEALFSGLPNEAILRAELRRMFRWLKSKNLTVIITAEKGDGMLTRHGLEEYISDCVIFLDHRVINQISTRRLRVVKYRGSSHGTNEYPTMIDETGLSVLPITSLSLDYDVTSQRVSTGIAQLDAALGGQGYFKGSSVLLSGGAGAGKSSLAGAFAEAACRREERCLYLAFEESPAQIIRNMASIGLNLKQWVRRKRLLFHAVRPSLYGLEQHLGMIHRLVNDFKPTSVVFDPVTNLINAGDALEVSAMLMRVIDFLKNQGITTVFTSLTLGGSETQQSNTFISSLMDTWLLLLSGDSDGVRKPYLHILKSRGMPHSNKVHELVLSSRGITLATEP